MGSILLVEESGVPRENHRLVRNKLSYLEDIASESSIICVTESHLDTNIIDNDIIIDGFSD